MNAVSVVSGLQFWKCLNSGNKKSIRFNPSIALIKGTENEYLLIYRVVILKKSLAGRARRPGSRFGLWNNWENMAFNGLGLSHARYNSNTNTLKVLHDQTLKFSNGMEDARIVPSQKYGEYFLTFTYVKIPPSGDISRKKNVMSTAVLTYNTDTNKAVIRHKKPICGIKTPLKGKNWIIVHDSSRLIYYLNHLQVHSYDAGENLCSLKSINPPQNVFGVVESHYNGHVIFSPSTPLVQFTAKSKLGVGHVKIYYENVLDDLNSGKLKLRATDPVLRFVKELQKTYGTDISENSYFAHVLYLMFYFETSNDVSKIIRVSDSILPQQDQSLRGGLIFPVGLTRATDNKNNFLVAFGWNDSKCVIGRASRSEITTLLNRHRKFPVKSQSYKFLVDTIGNVKMCTSK